MENTIEKTTIAPPIKWAGGKRWLVPELKKIYEKSGCKRIVEPFCGACSVSLGLQPKHALLNDINPHLILFWTFLRSGAILKEVGGNNREDFERARARFNEIKLPVPLEELQEVCSLFYYLNRTCFNGLFRVNSKGEFNVPFGKYKTISYRTSFPELTEAMLDWEFEYGDFAKLRTRKSDFLYADPPYDSEFVNFTSGGFTWEDQERLALWLSKQKCMVVASNAATSRIRKLYSSLGFKIRILEAPRRISCDGNREKAREMLAIKSS